MADDKPKIDLETIRHSTAHLMAQAVKQLYPDTQVTIGPVIEDGFYYDFYRESPFVPEDLEKIEQRMKDISSENLDITRRELPREEALRMFDEMGEPFNREVISDIESDEPISVYSQGEFTDLCRGPHVENTKILKSFKLLNVSAAYWRGDERNKVLQRIYGTAWHTDKELRVYLKRLEEAKKRDHRKLGKELDLFSITDEVGPGLILWHPKGSRIRCLMEDFWKEEHFKNGYEMVHSPHTARVDMWKKSGHMDFYKDNIFSPMVIEGKEYVMKPMNCPFHIQIYKSRLRSYRDLPLRFAELGTVYRYERSGVLHGLLRVRGFTQDDAHLFCRPNQIEEEIVKVLDLILFILRSFGFDEYRVYLSTRPKKFVGSEDGWEQATNALKQALEKSKLKYKVDPGEGVFYGPKIDFQFKTVTGREETASTNQLDFAIPEKLNLVYTAADGTEQHPYVIHRAPAGTHERFVAFLIEHFAGAFPTWMAPVQVKIIPVGENFTAYGEQLENELRGEMVRVELDRSSETMGKKVRTAIKQKIPHVLVIGEREMSTDTVTVRRYGSEEQQTIPFPQFKDQLMTTIRTRALDAARIF